MLVDTHAHIQMRQFDADRAAVVTAAFAAGVRQIVVPGVDVESSRAAVTLAAAYPGRVFAAVGTHPHDAATLDADALAEVRALARTPEVVAIGETGLDFYRNLAPRATQREALAAQLALARELDLPVILHNRDSHVELIELLRSHAQGVRGVFHCFIGDRAMARDALDLGFWLSFAGPVTYPRNVELAEVAAWAPLDHILVETDSPYLAPQPERGRRNEPRHVALTAQRIAELRGLAFEEFARATTQNAAALFRLPTISETTVPTATPVAPQEDDPACASSTP
jgi:TatD DNase family protein